MYLNLADVHRLMREGDVASGALLLIDSASEAAVARALKTSLRWRRLQARGAPELSRHDGGEHEPQHRDQSHLRRHHRLWRRYYNAARVSLSERSRELASLRVLGFHLPRFPDPVRRAGGPHAGGAAAPCSARAFEPIVEGRFKVRCIVSRCMSHDRRWPGPSSASLPPRRFPRCSSRRQLDRLFIVAVLKVREQAVRIPENRDCLPW